MKDPLTGSPYHPAYDLDQLSPSEVSTLNRPKRRKFDEEPVDALVKDVIRFPFIHFEKSLQLLEFLASSEFVADRTCAAFALSNLTIEADRRNAWSSEIEEMWMSAFCDHHISPRETSFAGFLEITDGGLVGKEVTSDIAILLLQELNRIYRLAGEE
jgi:hypothetical protein